MVFLTCVYTCTVHTHNITQRGAHGVVLVYDVSKRESFESIKSVWLSEVDEYCTRKSAAKIIVGNKVDVDDRKVSTEEGEDLARSGNAIFIELSAKTASGVSETFEKLIARILDTPELCSGNNTSSASIRPGDSAYSYADYCAC